EMIRRTAIFFGPFHCWRASDEFRGSRNFRFRWHDRCYPPLCRKTKAARLRCLEVNGFSSGMIKRAACIFRSIRSQTLSGKVAEPWTFAEIHRSPCPDLSLQMGFKKIFDFPQEFASQLS